MRHGMILFVWLLLSSWCWAGASRDFDGSNDRLDMGNTNDITTGSVSIAIWVNLDEDASNDAMIGKGPPGAAGYVLHEDDSASDVAEAFVHDGADSNNCGGGAFPDATWVFYAMTWNNDTNAHKSYSSGSAQASATQLCSETSSVIGSITNASNFRIGERGDAGNDMAGLAAYGMVWAGKDLTAVEIVDAQFRPGSIVDSLTGYWPIWGSESPEIDLSGSGFTGTVSGTTASASGPPVMVGDAPL